MASHLFPVEFEIGETGLDFEEVTKVSGRGVAVKDVLLEVGEFPGALVALGDVSLEESGLTTPR